MKKPPTVNDLQNTVLVVVGDAAIIIGKATINGYTRDSVESLVLSLRRGLCAAEELRNRLRGLPPPKIGD